MKTTEILIVLSHAQIRNSSLPKSRSYQMLFGSSATFIHRTRQIRKLSVLTGDDGAGNYYFHLFAYAYIYRSIEALIQAQPTT
jgi:hypothetical protein